MAKSIATALPAGSNTDILEIMTLGLTRIGVSFGVVTNALDVFTVSAKFHPDDTWHSLYAAITATPGGAIIAASGTLASTAAAGSGWFILDTRGIYAIKITVSGTVADTTEVDIYASGSR
jgi:hypothetical protein